MDRLITQTVSLIVVAIVVAIAARRLRLPYTVGLVAAGVTLALSHIKFGVALTHDIIFKVILPPLLFEAAINLRWRSVWRDRVLILLLSVAGVLITAVVCFFGIRILLGWPVAPALAFGILMAATDPVAVIALFKDLNFHGRARFLVEAESLFNDGVAAVLFGLMLAWLAGGQSASIPWHLLITTAGGGILVGVITGAAALIVAGRTGDPLVETAVTVVAAYGAFLLAENMQASGVLATVSAGLVVGSADLKAYRRTFGLSRHGRLFAIGFWEFMAFLANSVVFLLIGFAVSQFHVSNLKCIAAVTLIGLVLVSRALTVYPLCWLVQATRWRITFAEQHVLFWGGLRGALGLALALSLPTTLPMRGTVEVATFVVVIFSIVVQGLTMPALVQRMGLRAQPNGPDPNLDGPE